MDYAGAAESVCLPSVTGKGLFACTAVEAGRTIGFFVGELALFDLSRGRPTLKYWLARPQSCCAGTAQCARSCSQRRRANANGMRNALIQ